MKNSNDTIGNRTRDLPAYSVVPQPTVPPRNSHLGTCKEIIAVCTYIHTRHKNTFCRHNVGRLNVSLGGEQSNN